MEIDTAEKKRFQVKKWNAVSLWAWDIVVDNCAMFDTLTPAVATTLWISALNVKQIRLQQLARNVQ
jgi:hypothetical protein